MMLRAKYVTTALAAAIVGFSAVTFAPVSEVAAKASPKLQALIDGQAGRETSEQKRLQDLKNQNEEQKNLVRQFGDLTQEQIDLARQLEEKAKEFDDQAEKLAENFKKVAKNADALKAKNFEKNLRPLKNQLDRVRVLGFDLINVAQKAHEDGVRKPTFNGVVFSRSLIVLIRTGVLLKLTTIMQGDFGLAEELKDSLQDRTQFVEEFRKEGAEFNNGPKQAELNRFEQLRQNEQARQQEISRIEQLEQARKNGDNVLAALGNRIKNPEQGEVGQFANDTDARKRVQDLAQGLAGAGVRLDEIAQEEAKLDQQIELLNQQINPLDARLSQLHIPLRDGKELDEQIKERDSIIQRLAEDLEKVKKIEKDPEFLEKVLESGREFVDKIRADRQLLIDAREQTPQQIEGVKAELAKLEQDRKELNDRKELLLQQRRNLIKERNAIAALQAELAFLIRNGAPLHKDKLPARTDALNSFISGRRNGEGVLAQITPDGPVNFRAPTRDPLSPSQFGFDSTQGNSESTLGLSGNTGGGNISLIPCPAGSNALPVGTLVSDTGVCFI